jgi:predicted membrane-bound dolichyl-phosphate-mannose-protein mannosyltransferase
MNRIKKNSNIIILLCGALLMRLILSGFGTLELDQNTFIAWGHRAAEVGFSRFYEAWSDYLPGYIYVLWFLAKVETVVGVSSTLLYKLPAILGDIATGSLIYYILRKKRKLALVSTTAFLLNPAVLANSTLWGQVDIFSSLTSILAIASLGVWPVSAISFALGVSFKPQVLMAAPIIFILARDKGWSKLKFVKYGVVVLVAIFVIFMPFAGQNNLVSFVYERYSSTVDQYPYTSINAFNFWGLWGFWKEEAMGILAQKNIGILALSLVSLFTLYKSKIVSKRPYHFLSILLLTNFLFFTRMHERHLLPALAPLVIAAAANPILWVAYAGLSLTYVLNMHYSYQWITHDFITVFPENIVKIFILVNIVLFAAIIKQTLKPGKIDKIKLAFHPIKSIKFSKPKIVDRIPKSREKYFLTAILVFALVSRIVLLWVPDTDYFDEIYHAFTARQILSGDPLPWHWSSQHPEGFAYEWTHPPLAKEIMAASMGIFGVSPFAWRLPGALLGVATIYAVYLIAKKLFGSRDIALLAALLISLDGLVFTMSRIGTADVYFVAFALFSFYYFLKEKDLPSSIFLGLAMASKWSTIWFFPLFSLSFILLRMKFTKSLLWFFIMPPLIYLVSYFPMFTFGHDLNTFWGMQKQMWWYHSKLVATHPYTSSWWSWPLMLRPVYLYQDYKDGIIANIYAIGNPFFFWFGLTSIFASTIVFLKEKIKSLAVLIFGYFILFAPWALSPRIMFVYHYLPSLPLVAILLAFILKRYKWALLPMLTLIVVAFVYFYPHWTAIPVSDEFDKSYYWFASWR